LVHRTIALPEGDSKLADHLVPNHISGFFEFQGERERGKFSVFKGLQKPLSAQISRKLKMRRLPPTCSLFLRLEFFAHIQ
jgi:hypothetical protein